MATVPGLEGDRIEIVFPVPHFIRGLAGLEINYIFFLIKGQVKMVIQGNRIYILVGQQAPKGLSCQEILDRSKGMSGSISSGIEQHFGDLQDPRIDRIKLHELIYIWVIAICAVLAGADNWKDVE